MEVDFHLLHFHHCHHLLLPQSLEDWNQNGSWDLELELELEVEEQEVRCCLLHVLLHFHVKVEEPQVQELALQKQLVVQLEVVQRLQRDLEVEVQCAQMAESCRACSSRSVCARWR